MTVPLLVFPKQTRLFISAATCWLITYIIAHVHVIVLRKRYPNYKRPFKTPLYPLTQIIGILSMAYAIYNNAPTSELGWKVYLNAAIFRSPTAIYAFFWVRYKMKRGLFDPEPIEQALKD